MNSQNGSSNNSAFDLSDSTTSSSASNSAKSDAELAEELEGGKSKTILLGVIFGFLGVLLLAGFFVADPLSIIGNDDKEGDTSTVVTDNNASETEDEAADEGIEEPVPEIEWWQEEETKYPVVVEDWTTQSYSEYLSGSNNGNDDGESSNGSDAGNGGSDGSNSGSDGGNGGSDEGNGGSDEGNGGSDGGNGGSDGSNGGSDGSNGGSDGGNDSRNQLAPKGDIPKSVEALNEYIAGSAGGVHISSGAGALPSEAAGYTSDFNQMVLADGSFNPMYSAWTKETFHVELQKSITRFINPEFGGWTGAQYSSWPRSNDSVLVNRMADMFTADYLTENEGKPVSSYLPLFADWNNNDYGLGDTLLNPGPRWYGVLQNATITFDKDEETRAYTAKVVADVKYTAWTKDQSKVERNGTLTLNVVQPKSQRTHYLVFDRADLKME